MPTDNEKRHNTVNSQVAVTGRNAVETYMQNYVAGKTNLFKDKFQTLPDQ